MVCVTPCSGGGVCQLPVGVASYSVGAPVCVAGVYVRHTVCVVSVCQLSQSLPTSEERCEAVTSTADRRGGYRVLLSAFHQKQWQESMLDHLQA